MTNALPSLDTLFSEAVEITDAGDRAAYLAQACPDDTLRRRVEALVVAHFRAGSFLGEPPTTTDVPDPADEPEAVIGHYKLRECLGEGGMGAVYVAEQTEPVRRRVALKVIKPGMDTREVVARFEAERQALALMDHPHIAKVFDGGATAAGRPYFVMELVRGLPITEYCDQAKLPAERRLRLFAQVCRAVQHAHQKGVIHRDMKPSNVLVTLHDGEPVPKVIDFGIAKAVNQPLTDKSVYTRFNQLVGTPMYMAPEQAELSGLDIDTRSDVYSLGVLLYELLTGTTPFDAETLRKAGFDEMRRMIREDEPPRPSARVSTLDAEARSTAAGRRGLDERQLGGLLRGDLDWVAMKALEKDRNRRYESAGAFAADIERYLAHEPVQARPPSVVYRLRKFARRNKAAVTSTALVTLAILLGAGASLWKYFDERAARRDADDHRLAAERSADDARRQTDDAIRARREAVTVQQEAERQRNAVSQNLYTADMRLGLVDWQAGNLNRLLRKLADHVPRTAADDRRGWEWYYLLALCNQDERTLMCNSSLPLMSVVWSPDGRYVAATGTSQPTRVWDTTTWRPLRSFIRGTRALSWSPDGRHLASGTLADDSTVRVWDARTDEVAVLGSHESSVWTTAWSPDGRRLASAGLDRTIRIWDPAARTCLAVWNVEDENIYAVAWNPGGDRIASASSIHGTKIWDATTGQVVRELSRESAQAVAWRPDAKQLAVGRGDGSCALYESQDGFQTIRWDAHAGAVTGVAWSADGGQLVSSGVDSLIHVWDAKSGNRLHTLRGHCGQVSAVTWEPNGQRVASAGVDRTVKIWHLPPVSQPRRLGERNSGVQAIAWGREPDTLMSFDGESGTVTAWNVATGHARAQATAASGRYGRFSPGGALVAVAAGEDDAPRMLVCDTRTGQTVQTFAAPDPIPTPARDNAWFSPDGSRLAVSNNRNLNVVDRRGTVVRCKGAPWTVTGSWSPDGRLVAVAGHGEPGDGGTLQWAGWVYVYEPATGRRVWKMQHGTERVMATAVAWSPDGRRLVSGDLNGSTEVWDVAAARKVFGKRLHTAQINALCWSPDGRRIASGSKDRTVRIWDATDGEELIKLDDPRAEVVELQWSPDGRRLAAAGADGSIHVWDAMASYRHIESEAYAKCMTEIYGEAKQFDRAESLLVELLERGRASNDPDSPRARFLYHLGRARFLQRKYAEAEPTLRECVAAYEQSAPDDWLRFDALSLLGCALLGQGKHAEAEPPLLQGYEGMKRQWKAHPWAYRQRFHQAIQRIVQLYDAAGRPEAARTWRAKLPVVAGPKR